MAAIGGTAAMETAVQIEFRGTEATPQARKLIARHLDQLEERFGRITAGRVVVTGPGGHHRTGGQYGVSIHCTLPMDKEVAVARTASTDERFADLSFAINDAFKRARRQLQDAARKLQGQVKTHRKRGESA
jgi:ribosome-associated translation inhibitor RaiA